MWVKDAVQLLYGSKDNGQGEKYWKSANELCWIKKQYVTENASIFSIESPNEITKGDYHVILMLRLRLPSPSSLRSSKVGFIKLPRNNVLTASMYFIL